MDPKRFRAIAEMLLISKRQTVESFFGLVNYYRRFLSNLSKIEAPLRKLVTNSQFSWSDSAQRSFDSIKSAIAANTVLAYPDPKAILILDTDDSDVGLKAVLSQIGPDHVERIIAFASRVL